MYANEKKNNELVNKQVNQKATKQARKEAKRLKKEGYIVPIGKISIDKQLEQAWRMQYELTENGPKYIIGSANSVAGNQNAARLQATNMAKLDLVAQMESQLAQMIEMKVANQEMSTDDAETITSMVSSSKTIISGKLGQVTPVVDVYRQLPNGNFECQVTLGYDSNEAFKVTRDAIRADLNKRADGLAEKLDQMIN
ncbi:MAG: hypothetical protein LUH15_00365 [Tannerellaceae bacterium]|nr:hypothetical protein [Tannerellaceae bacterium]